MRRNLSVIGTSCINFDGECITDTFIVDEVMLETMPAATIAAIHVPGRNGNAFASVDYGTRTGSIRVSLNTGHLNRLDSIGAYKRMTDVFFTSEPKKLQLGEFYVMAQFTGSSDYEQVGIYGSATLNFECPDPWLYYREKSISLVRGSNSIICTSPFEVWPTFSITGASTSFTLTNNDTGDKVVVPSGFTSSQTLKIYMERERCEVNGNYIAVSNDLTDFFMIQPGKNSITLSSGSGTLTYTERRL